MTHLLLFAWLAATQVFAQPGMISLASGQWSIDRYLGDNARNGTDVPVVPAGLWQAALVTGSTLWDQMHARSHGIFWPSTWKTNEDMCGKQDANISSRASAAFYFPLCQHGPPFPCINVVYWALSQMRECERFHDGFIRHASQETGLTFETSGFWSSRCRCGSVFGAVMKAFLATDAPRGGNTCGSSGVASYTNSLQLYYSGSESNPPYKNQIWLIVAGGNQTIQDTGPLADWIRNDPSQRPWYVKDYMSPHVWQCSAKLDPKVARIADYTPWLGSETEYVSRLFWATGPVVSRTPHVPTPATPLYEGGGGGGGSHASRTSSLSTTMTRVSSATRANAIYIVYMLLLLHAIVMHGI